MLVALGAGLGLGFTVRRSCAGLALTGFGALLAYRAITD